MSKESLCCGDSPEAVAFVLMKTIVKHDAAGRTKAAGNVRKYYLNKYKECLDRVEAEKNEENRVRRNKAEKAINLVSGSKEAVAFELMSEILDHSPKATKDFLADPQKYLFDLYEICCAVVNGEYIGEN